MDLKTIISFLDSKEYDKIEEALDAISDLKPSNSIELILPYLDHENEDIRSGAVFNLGELKDRQAIPYIKNFIRKEKSKYHRGFGILALGNFISEDILNFLGELFKDGDILLKGNRFSKMNIADQLGNYSEYEYALDLLEVLLKDENPKVRIHSVDALVRFKSKRVEKIWITIFNTEKQNQYILDLSKTILIENFGK